MILRKNYSEEERKHILRWCGETLKLYFENVDQHGMEPDMAQAKTLLEIQQALNTEVEEMCCPHPAARHSKSLTMSSDESLEGLCQDCDCRKLAHSKTWPGYRG